MKRSLGSILGLLLAAASTVIGATPGYVLIMKNGSRVETKAKPEIKGKNYVYKTPLGTTQMVPVADVDEAKTEAANKDGIALKEIESPESRTPPPATPTALAAAKGTPDIVELARQRKAEKAAREKAEKEAAEAALATPTPTPTPKKKG